MRLRTLLVALIVAAAGLPVMSTAEGSPTPAAAPEGRLSALVRTADGRVSVSRESSTGRIGFVGAARGGDLLPGVPGRGEAAATAKAQAFLRRFAPVLGAPAGQLRQTMSEATVVGWTVTFDQFVDGVPVIGGRLKVQVDRAGALTAVSGFAAPSAGVSVRPSRSSYDAAARAVLAVRASRRLEAEESGARAELGRLRAESSSLAVFHTGSIRGIPGRSVLVHSVIVTDDANVRDVVLVDARTLKPVAQWSLVHGGTDRHLLEAAGSVDPATFTAVWDEGDPFPGDLDRWQATEVDTAGDIYRLFANSFGRASYDGSDHAMTTINNDGRIFCPNANWNGETANFCDGTATDDVVAHEWAHAYTEHTSNLIYQWQPGALNESFSDVWGETVDLINAKQDAEEGDLVTPRPVGRCATHTGGRPVLTIDAPASVAKECEAGEAQFGPPLTRAGVAGEVVLALDSDATDGVSNACSALTNAADVDGHLALVDRGGCAFTVKVRHAQDAGATAVLVADTVEGPPGPLAGRDPAITIPAARIRLSDGRLIRTTLASGPVTVTLRLDTGDSTDSFRWLMGEDATAFGGAIRDMWSPTCYGDPGRVGDFEYHCDTSDGGGVHRNSGVPNHLYALVVDGGTYHGHTVAGLGLDRAAHLWWRAQSAYLTPTSDFADLADALESSCSDLVGQPLAGLTTEPDATPTPADRPIGAADCAALSEAIAAVQLRVDPRQCAFKPLLDPRTPGLCGPGTVRRTVWSETFEDGLAGWTGAATSVFGGPASPWRATRSVPGRHPGRVAYASDPIAAGDCSGTATDVSSAVRLTSRAFTLPDALKTPRLSFDHYVATEPGWDGGNVAVSINGGPFAVVPRAAYVFNGVASGGLTPADAGNTNPMAGQDAFTGTDGGVVSGSWGTSQISLRAIGAGPGDSLRIRLAFGRDGCGGMDGWYVDNLRITVCRDKSRLRGRTPGSAAGREGQ